MNKESWIRLINATLWDLSTGRYFYQLYYDSVGITILHYSEKFLFDYMEVNIKHL